MPHAYFGWESPRATAKTNPTASPLPDSLTEAIGRGVEKEFLSMLIHGISTCKNVTGQIW